MDHSIKSSDEVPVPPSRVLPGIPPDWKRYAQVLEQEPQRDTPRPCPIDDWAREPAGTIRARSVTLAERAWFWPADIVAGGMSPGWC